MLIYLLVRLLCRVFFFSSRRRHTRCALVTGVQTCALPILLDLKRRGLIATLAPLDRLPKWQWTVDGSYEIPFGDHKVTLNGNEIGRASCRERVCQYV